MNGAFIVSRMKLIVFTSTQETKCVSPKKSFMSLLIIADDTAKQQFAQLFRDFSASCTYCAQRSDFSLHLFFMMNIGQMEILALRSPQVVCT